MKTANYLFILFLLIVCCNKRPETVQLPPEQMKKFVGFYSMVGNSRLQIEMTDKGDHLLLKQLWDSGEMELLPVSDREFWTKMGTIKFDFDEAQAPKGFLAFGHDQWVKTK